MAARVSADVESGVVELYRADVSPAEIGARYGIHRFTVTAIAKRNGLALQGGSRKGGLIGGKFVRTDAHRLAMAEAVRGQIPHNRGKSRYSGDVCPNGHDLREYQVAYRDSRYPGARIHGCRRCRNDRALAYLHRDGRGNRRRRELGAPGSHTPAEWAELCTRFGGRCLRCRCLDRPLTRDHIVPIWLGGSNDIDNIQPLCRPCNSAKYLSIVDYRGTRSLGRWSQSS